MADLAGDYEVAVLDAVEVELDHAGADPLAVAGELGGEALGFELGGVGLGEAAADGARGAVGAGVAGLELHGGGELSGVWHVYGESASNLVGELNLLRMRCGPGGGVRLYVGLALI